MLSDRQQFEVREPQVDDVRDQLFREFVVSQELAALAASPGSQVNLEN